MGFAKGTPIFTDSGWKNIEDISGHDQVLVRNFLGDAEFIQPFALKKSHFKGEIIKIGAKDWNFSVTPDHRVVYDRSKRSDRQKMENVPARDLKTGRNVKIYRKFKYMFAEDRKKEMVIVRNDFGKQYVTISNYDWYKLVGYVLTKGFIKTGRGRPMLYFYLDENKMDEEILTLSDIFDRLNITWHVQYSEKTRPKFVVSSRNTLSDRLITRLGSSKRKDMYLPDLMIYNTTRELSKLLIETIIETTIKPETERGSSYQLSTTNTRLIDSLTLLGTLSGYSVRYTLKAKAGQKAMKGETKKDSFILHIGRPVDAYSPTYVKKSPYNGSVYEIDLFEGQIYTKEGSMPVWVNPK